MVRAVAGEHDGAALVAAPAVVGAGDLEGELVGLAAARREREDRIVDRDELGEHLRELDRLRMREPGVEGDEVELADLPRDALADLSPAVPDLAGAEMAAGVEQHASLGVPDVRALGADDHARVLVRIGGLELPEVGEEVADRMPCALPHLPRPPAPRARVSTP